MSDKLLSFAAVARKIGISRPTLYSWQETGKFDVLPHPDNKHRWRESDIDAYIAKPRNDDQPRFVGI